MTSQSLNNPVQHALSHWRDYLEITKPKVVLLLVFTALVGMALAVPGWLPLQETLFGLVGIGLASSSAAAINHVIDQRTDAIMKRTENRPIPQGALTTKQCLVFAFLIGALGMGYAVVYTMYLKRATPQNIVIGGAAGAMPPLLGWVAVTGEVTAGALLLFLIVFVWTPPHFWALAIHRRDDYAKVDIPMLPVTRHHLSVLNSNEWPALFNWSFGVGWHVFVPRVEIVRRQRRAPAHKNLCILN